MKRSSASNLPIIGIFASVLVILSSCGESAGRSGGSEIDTATVKPSVPAVTEVTATTTTAETTTAAATSSKVLTTTTTTTAAVSEPDKTENEFTEEQLNELAKQQRQQLMSVSIGYKDAYLTFVRSKLIFKVLLGSAGMNMDPTEVFNRITETEDEYYGANLLIFGDRDDINVRDFKLTLAEDDLQTASAVVYRMTFTADADSTEVPMEGYVLDLGDTVMSVSRPSEGITP